MQRHDRRVPVSFFSRYTRDIAKFADEHCRGRVISVLEGGYSDRALTSAAMGHVVGMLGQEGDGDWWNPASLDQVGLPSVELQESKLIDLARACNKEEAHGQDCPIPARVSPSPSSFPYPCASIALRSCGSARRSAIGSDDTTSRTCARPAMDDTPGETCERRRGSWGHASCPSD
jgi:hypothetical protein